MNSADESRAIAAASDARYAARKVAMSTRAPLRIGDYVRVWKDSGTLKNSGRVGRVLTMLDRSPGAHISTTLCRGWQVWEGEYDFVRPAPATEKSVRAWMRRNG